MDVRSQKSEDPKSIPLSSLNKDSNQNSSKIRKGESKRKSIPYARPKHLSGKENLERVATVLPTFKAIVETSGILESSEKGFHQEPSTYSDDSGIRIPRVTRYSWMR